MMRTASKRPPPNRIRSDYSMRNSTSFSIRMIPKSTPREFRTLPMVWYVPPLSPVRAGVGGREGTDEDVFASIDQMRIPIEYLANLLAAGDTGVIRTVLKKLAAMRGYMRAKELGGTLPLGALASLDLNEIDVEAMYRLLGIAKYEDRFVIPPAHVERARARSTKIASSSHPRTSNARANLWANKEVVGWSSPVVRARAWMGTAIRLRRVRMSSI